MNKFRNISISLQRKSQSKMVKVVIYSILYLFGLGENPMPRRSSRIKHQSDFDAIRSDWDNIGMDIYNAMGRYKQQEYAQRGDSRS